MNVFQVQQDLHLQAFIGDKVHIFEETDHWYLACLARNTGIRGIIPKVRIIYNLCKILVVFWATLGNIFFDQNFVMVREESGVGGGAVVQESTAMLREWGRMLR